MPFDTISAPAPTVRDERPKSYKIITYRAGFMAYSKKIAIGSLYFLVISFFMLFSGYLIVVKPYEMVEAAGKSASVGSQKIEIKKSEPNEFNLQEMRVVSLKPLSAQESIPTKARAVSRVLRRGGFEPIYMQAEKKYGVPWQVIAAVHSVESGQSGDNERVSSAGALGPMQFMPPTFEAYKQDGDGDGVASIYDVHDAIFSAANYMAANGANRGAVSQALYRYNHSYEYVARVLELARDLGYSG